VGVNQDECRQENQGDKTDVLLEAIPRSPMIQNTTLCTSLELLMDRKKKTRAEVKALTMTPARRSVLEERDAFSGPSEDQEGGGQGSGKGQERRAEGDGGGAEKNPRDGSGGGAAGDAQDVRIRQGIAEEGLVDDAGGGQGGSHDPGEEDPGNPDRKQDRPSRIGGRFRSLPVPEKTPQDLQGSDLRRTDEDGDKRDQQESQGKRSATRISRPA
jgi:hypothetical protein